MVDIPLPFRLKGLPLASRLILWVAGAGAGISLQIMVPALRIPGLILVALAALIPLATRVWTNKPKDQGEEEWVAASSAEIDRLVDNFKQTRSLKIPAWYRAGSGIGCSVALGILFILIIVNAGPGWVVANVLFILFPLLNFLTIQLWVPREFEMILGAVHAFMGVPTPKNQVLTPYLRLDRDDKGLRVPESARLLLEPRRKKDDLVGIQVQAAINNGPNGAVPYLYAVVLTKGEGPSWRIASAFKVKGYEVESGSSEEGGQVWGTVVIRQRTARGGYHTTPANCRKLATICHELIDALSGDQG